VSFELIESALSLEEKGVKAGEGSGEKVYKVLKRLHTVIKY